MTLRTIAEPLAPPALDADDVEVWRDADGTLAAAGYQRGGGHCLYVPQVGTFRFDGTGDEMEIAPDPAAPADLIQDAYHRVAMPLALQLHGVQTLHASAALVDDGVVALCGRSGAGKSTLAYGLSRRGFPLWGDDAVAFEPSYPGQFRVTPLPFRMRLRPASARWFDDVAHQKGSERSAPWQTPPEPRAFRALFVLGRTEEPPDGEPLQIERLVALDAFAAVLPHAYYLALDDRQLNRELLSAYLVAAERLPIFALRYAPGLERVDEITARIAATVRAL